MNRLIKITIPSTALTFTLVSLFRAVINLLNGYTSGSNQGTLELFAFLVLLQLVDVLFSIIDFKKYLHYLLVKLAVMYGIFLAGGYLLHWFSFDLPTLLLMTLTFAVIYGVVHRYFNLYFRREAASINRLLAKQGEKSDSTASDH